MGDPHHDIQIDDSSSSHTTSASSSNTISSPKFSVMLKNMVCFPAVLLILSLATSTINILIYTSILFQWLAFILLVSSFCVFSGWIVTTLIFFIERYVVMKTNRAFYFVFALKTSLQYFFCSCSILFSWFLLVKPDMTIFVIHLITSTLVTSVIATVMWMVKIVILKGLDCRFHDKNFFQNIQDLTSNEYVLQTLLGFLRESRDSNDSTMRAHRKWIKRATNNMIVCTRLWTISHVVENSNFDHDHDHIVEYMISLVLKNITNNEHRDIQETDLQLVMKKEVIADLLRLFDGATETKRISQESLRNWMVQVCNDRKKLVQLLNSSRKVIVQLNKNALVIQSLLVVIVWCLLMGIKTTKSLVFITLLLLVFGYYCKIIFEGVMLAIVMLPFDIGDHCDIDNEQLVVEDIGLISTTFLKENGIKWELQNSVLLTKSIGNLNRSSELTDTFEIIVSSTTYHKFEALKHKIYELIESKPENWRGYWLNLKAIDDAKHIYILEITYSRKFQNYKVKKNQRSELIFELKKFLEDLEVMNVTIQ